MIVCWSLKHKGGKDFIRPQQSHTKCTWIGTKDEKDANDAFEGKKEPDNPAEHRFMRKWILPFGLAEKNIYLCVSP